MAKRVSVAQVEDRLSVLAEEVAYEGQQVIIEHDGRPLAAIVSVGCQELLEQDCSTSARPQGALALVGAWREVDDKDIESLIKDIYAGRESDVGRAVESSRGTSGTR